MENRLTWGILATGGIAEMFAADLLTGGHRIGAVGSRSREKAAAFAEKFGIARAHGSYEALVRDPGIDIVYVATPHPMHAEAALMALAAGKHVLVEKPFTLNAREAEKVIAFARSRDLVVLEAMWTRFLPHMVRIREIIAAGTLGDVRAVTASHCQVLPEDPGHRINALELGGGALLDLGIYPISLAWDILGPPLEIKAMARFKSTGADAEIATLFRHRDGALSSTHSASDIAGSNSAVIIGTRARIEIAGTWYQPTSFRVIAPDGTELQAYESRVAGRGMQYQAAELEHLVGSGTPAGTILPPDQTLAIMKTLDAIRDQIGLRYPGESGETG